MNMKTTKTLLRTGLVGLFLFAAFTGKTQIIPSPVTTVSSPSDLQVGTLEDGVAPITPTDPPAIFFYREASTEAPTGTTITLRASLTDESAQPITFNSYVWYKMVTPDGTSEPLPTTPLSETGRDLKLENLQPGYHKYRVYGVVEDGEAICQSEEFQDIIFFVLRPLAPTASAETDAITEFCIDNPTNESLNLTTTVDFATPGYDGNYANPDVEAFDLSYRWYAVKDGETTQIDLFTTTANGATHTLTLDGANDGYAALVTAGVGTYTFYVEVQYSNTIKDREEREHAIWNSQVTANGTTDPYQLTLTPTPGRPTITIEDITD